MFCLQYFSHQTEPKKKENFAIARVICDKVKGIMIFENVEQKKRKTTKVAKIWLADKEDLAFKILFNTLVQSQRGIDIHENLNW